MPHHFFFQGMAIRAQTLLLRQAVQGSDPFMLISHLYVGPRCIHYPKGPVAGHTMCLII